mmetsp:Transcript_29881/g.102915  ORF Transcript_29881/g.102915 Transcript_29881/m.102915 type:complete len:320 (-) Transcript_29881:73-1032(-)
MRAHVAVRAVPPQLVGVAPVVARFTVDLAPPCLGPAATRSLVPLIGAPWRRLGPEARHVGAPRRRSAGTLPRRRLAVLTLPIGVAHRRLGPKSRRLVETPCLGAPPVAARLAVGLAATRRPAGARRVVALPQKRRLVVPLPLKRRAAAPWRRLGPEARHLGRSVLRRHRAFLPRLGPATAGGLRLCDELGQLAHRLHRVDMDEGGRARPLEPEFLACGRRRNRKALNVRRRRRHRRARSWRHLRRDLCVGPERRKLETRLFRFARRDGCGAVRERGERFVEHLGPSLRPRRPLGFRVHEMGGLRRRYRRRRLWTAAARV